MKRRDFLRQSLLASAASGALFTQFGQLKLLNAAINARAGGKGLGDFKALVCVFQHGGNDGFNMLVPSSGAARTAYLAARGELAIGSTPSNPAPLLALSPLQAPSDGASYGLHPGMQGVQQLFAGGQCAVVANVGPLLYPISKAEFQQESVPVPPQLFSHSDQSLAWQTSWTDSTTRTGWGGRLVDAVLAGQELPAVSSCISLDGANVLQVGDVAQPYFMDSAGGQSLFFIENEWNQDRRASFLAIQQLARESGGHVFERSHARVMDRALDNFARVSAALASAPTLQTTFPDSYLGRQLAMVARLIAVHGALGQSRQLYFVSQGGYDTHNGQLGEHQQLLPDLSNCLKAFYDAGAELGMADSVTSFTASDFGRTVSINGDGTDHGWGGHHVVVGGAVRGKAFYGVAPPVSIGNTAAAEDQWHIGQGRLIPSTSVDQYAATLARWFGVADNELAGILPNLRNFGAAAGFPGYPTNLGFLG